MDVESARRVGARDEKTLKTICSRERREEAVISVYYIGEKRYRDTSFFFFFFRYMPKRT